MDQWKTKTKLVSSQNFFGRLFVCGVGCLLIVHAVVVASYNSLNESNHKNLSFPLVLYTYSADQYSC